MRSLPSRQEIIRRRLEDHFEERSRRSVWLPIAAFIVPAAAILLLALFLSPPRSGGVSLNPIATLGDAVSGLGDLYGGGSFKSTLPADADEETPTPSPASTPDPTATPVPTADLSAITGDPFSAEQVADVFEAGGLKVSQPGLDQGEFSGISGKVVALELGDGSPTRMLLIVYPSSGAVGDDWETRPGQAPRLKSGHTLPEAESVWWNRNIVILILDRGDHSSTAYDAFFELR
jgi:hypothetical protein